MPRLVAFAFAVLSLTAASAPAQQVVTSGPWTITVGPGGPSSIAYKGEVLLRNGAVAGYLPGWAGNRFSLADGRLVTTAQGALWSKEVPDNQDATLTVTAAGNKVTLALETTLRAGGPTEYSVEIVPEAVQANEKQCALSLNGKPVMVDWVGKFAPLNGVNELRFEQPERTIIVRSQSALLQDRREQGSVLFLVSVLNGEGKTVTEKRTVEVEVQEAKPEEVEGRRAWLSQVAEERTDVPVPNGDFEAGLAEWSENPRAVADAEVKHGGRQSARVTIPADQTDRTGIYLVQNIPVTGGWLYAAEAWVKTQDVKAARLGDMSATGATVIIEWADREGKWMASGDYASGSYGTTEWQRVATNLMRAPKEAGYAIIFLSMRATGTAWFDDVKLTQVKRNVALMRPGLGAKVADNTPEFDWQYLDPANALLELSQDETFPEGKTLRFPDIQERPFSPAEPLAQGKWFWRVSIPEHTTVSATWQFEQTVPVTQDCTPPVVAADHAYLASARQPVTVRLSDNVGVTKVALSLDGRNVEGQVRPAGVRYTPTDDWKPGLHKLDVEAQDDTGNKTSRRIFLNYAPGVAAKRWLVEGGVEIGGQPQFLLGMYGVRIEDMSELAKAGYDYVHNYTWDGSGSNESATEYLDACRANGLQAFIGFDRAKLQARDEEFVAERIGALCRHPALLAWYLFDEPDLPHQYVPPDQLRGFYRLIRALDPMHPVIVTVAQGNMMPLYHDSYDVYWSMDYSTPASNAANFEFHHKALKPDVPIMSIVHCFDGKQPGPGKGGDPTEFEPGPAQLRACAFMAIAHNSSGLCWWWWGQGSDAYLTVANAPTAWDGLKETVRQIRALRPVLEAQLPTRTWIEKPAEGIEVHLWEKRLPDRTVVIAVNRDKAPCDLTFEAAGFAGRPKAQVLFEDRALDLANGRLTDHFEPWAVHIYGVR
jgi:hypothetical protein